MKILKPGQRPLLVLGTISVLAVLTPLCMILPTGKVGEALKAAGFMLFLPVLLLGPMVFFRIELDDEEIRIWNFGRVKQRARFENIGHSVRTVLAEKDWPTTLTLVAQDGESVLMTIGLKALRKEDVTWLLSLPQLKIER